MKVSKLINGFKAWNGNNSIGDYIDLGMPLDHDDIKAALKANPNVTHVCIPHTHIGYGAGVLEYANNEALERDYPRRLHTVKGLELAFTRNQVIRYAELWEIIRGLAYDYPSMDDEILSRLTSETLFAHVLECLTDELFMQDVEFTDTQVGDWLHANYELWNDGQTCYLDNDGATPYMSKDSLDSLVSAYCGK